jgi:hypothetical protein
MAQARILATGVLLAFGLVASEVQAGDKVIVEVSRPLRGGGGLGTMGYLHTEKEAPFLKKVNDESPPLWVNVRMPPAVGEAKDPAKEKEEKKRKSEEARAKAYSLIKQEGKYAGWFAIVREKTWDPNAKKTCLLLEHKYFDGLTDLHIQIASIYGAGDFAASVPGKAEEIPLLSLVRVYGPVSKGQRGGMASVDPEYVRVWKWGLFTFMDYGLDKSNPKWVKLRKVSGSDVYSPRPTKRFYEERLGKQPE